MNIILPVGYEDENGFHEVKEGEHVAQTTNDLC